VFAAAWSRTTATGSDGPIDPEHVIQLAVRAAEAAEKSPGAEISKKNSVGAGGVWPLLAAEAELDVDGEPLLAVEADFDAGGEPQAIASKASSDAIAAARFMGVTCLTVGCRFGYGDRNAFNFDALSGS
jgi:hypothetical protein